MTTISALKSKLPILLALGCLAGLMTLIAALFKLPLGSVGTVDFVQYWSAWRVMLDGGNCYDPAVMHAVQSSLTTKPFPLTFSWNPPWTYVLLAPVLALPFEQSATLWLLVEILLLGTIVTIVPPTFALPRLQPLTAAIVVTLFFPILNSIYWGQLGILLATSVALFLFFEQRGKHVWAGLALLPLAMKPHLFLLFIPPAMKWMRQIQRRDLRSFLLGALGGFSILVAATLVIAPASITSWVNSFSASSAPAIKDHSIHFQDWQTATIATWLRIAINSLTNELPSWPLTVLPLAGILASVAYFFTNRRPIVWREVTPPLLCLSLLMSNYGWPYDQSVLLICHIMVICRARYYSSPTLRVSVLTATVSIQLLAFLLARNDDTPQHYFAWIPLALLCILAADARIRQNESN